MKYITATRDVTAGILKLLVYLVDRLSVSCGNLLAANTAYLVGSGRRTLIAIHGKFAVVSKGILINGLRNLDKFVAEILGPYVVRKLEVQND